MTTRYKYTESQVVEWYEKYLQLKSSFKVAEFFNVGHATVWRRLKQYEKKRGLNNITNFKYSVNNDFFEQDTPASFYWAGFIAADGNISKYRKNRLSIGLSHVDASLLHKFKKCIEFTGSVGFKEDKIGRGGKSANIFISSRKIVHDLLRFNITPCKTKTYLFPQWLITHPLVNHFMRGYFDGDGTIYLGKYGPSFRVYGREEFVTIYENILVKYCGLKKNKIYDCDTIKAIAYGGWKNIIKIREFIYKDATQEILLNRKYNKMFGI